MRRIKELDGVVVERVEEVEDNETMRYALLIWGGGRCWSVWVGDEGADTWVTEREEYEYGIHKIVGERIEKIQWEWREKVGGRGFIYTDGGVFKLEWGWGIEKKEVIDTDMHVEEVWVGEVEKKRRRRAGPEKI